MPSDQDHVSDFFKKNAHLLDEMPQQNLWKVLSQRLYKEKQKKQVIRSLNLGLAVAASLLLVVNMMWIYAEITKKSTDAFVFIENYNNAPQHVYQFQKNELARKTSIVSEAEDLPVEANNHDTQKSSQLNAWSYGNNTPKNIKELSAITGAWVLPSWYQLDQYKNIPNSINVFHTNDDKYYLNMDNDHHEAYLMQSIRAVDKFKVLHPQINVIDNSNNTVLIVYFDSGLIVDYQRKDSRNHRSFL